MSCTFFLDMLCRALYSARHQTGRGKTMKVIGYCRVSSQEQASEGLSLQMQQDKIRQYAQLHDLELIEIITDAGVSAKNISGRPGLTKALDMVLNGDVDGLVSWKLDRVFRSLLDATQTLEQFKRASKRLILISEMIDTGSAMGEFVYNLFASLAQLERRLTGERTKSVLESKKSRNEHVGKPRYGYTPEGKFLACNTEQQLVIQKVKDMSSSMSCRAIAKALNEQGILTKQAKLWTHKQISAILA